jgi:putative transposase
VVAVEDLDVRAMTRSARGTVDEPGRNVRAKAGLNRAIADSAWGELRELLAYKLEERGGQLVAVPAQHTSQTCTECGYRGAENRPSRALFACAACGHQAHADVNAARVIAQRGEQKLYGSGETRVDDAAMAAPMKPNPPPQSDPARAVATPSGVGRDSHYPAARTRRVAEAVATPSGADRDIHPPRKQVREVA